MKLGRINTLFLIFLINFSLNLKAEDKILTAPIINLENLEPSYENLDPELDTNLNDGQGLKNRKSNNNKKKIFQFVNLIGLDKITAKTIPIKVKLGETVKFGLLEIKVLKCGVSKGYDSKKVSAAYLQVKDISENQNEKVFIFNGWTFSSNPSITPIDHAVYDVWLVGCSA